MDTSKKHWYEYLTNTRGLKPDIVKRAQITQKQGWLYLPVFNTLGEFMFGKHRVLPWNPDQSLRYKYDVGGHTALYNAQNIPGADIIYITEGEIDALTIDSLEIAGVTAVSSTGGCMSFKSEWAEHFAAKKVVVIYDADGPGVVGAAHTVAKFRNKEIIVIFIPANLGKDVNDIYTTHGGETLHDLISNPLYRIHVTVPELSTQKNIKEFYSQCGKAASAYNAEDDQAIFYRALATEIKKLITKKSRPAVTYTDDSQLTRAKLFPIEKLVRVNGKRFFVCPFHNDTNPSMHLYKNNTAYCFVCDTYADAIDIYGAVNGINSRSRDGFKQILNQLAP